MQQLKYRVKYGFSHSVGTSQEEVGVWAFDIEEAIKIANKVADGTGALAKITRIELLKE